MAEQTLSNGGAGGVLSFSTNQVNTFVLKTANQYSDTNITLTTKVTKAVLNTTSDDTDHKIFNIQIPNGDSTDITLTFTVDSNGNTTVT